MSPKSRGRPAGRGKKQKPRRPTGPARELRVSERVLQHAGEMVAEPDALEVERWASLWLGIAWSAASVNEREAERQLVLEVIDRASTRPSPPGLAALRALRRVALEGELTLLDEAIDLLAQSEAEPSWAAVPAFEAVQAWRAVDVYDSERVLFVEYASPGAEATGHTLVAQVIEAGTTMLSKVAVLAAGAATSWEAMHEPDAPPMPLTEIPVAEALADLADCLRTTDLVWPQPEDPEFVDLRALAWARSRAFLADPPEFVPLTDAERDDLEAAFAASGRTPEGLDADVVRSLVEVFLNFGDGYLHARPLGWSPRTVAMFLADWLPRKVVLDAEQRAALPDLLRSWIRFGLGRRGLDPQWIEPVLDAVDEWLPDFGDALADSPAQT